jgi:hypothetical protein
MVDIDRMYETWVRAYGPKVLKHTFPLKETLQQLYDWFLRECEARGIDPQAIDFEKHVTPKLEYKENQAVLLGLMTGATEKDYEALYEHEKELLREQARAWGLLDEYERRIAELEKEAKAKEKYEELAKKLKRELEERAARPELSIVPFLSTFYFDKLREIFMGLPGATEAAFRGWLVEFADRLREKHREVVPGAWEPYMREYLARAPKAAPPAEERRPEPKFRVGEEVYSLDEERSGTVRQAVWNAITRSWDYLVEIRGRVVRKPEGRLVSLPPLPAVPRRPPERPPAPPKPPEVVPVEEIAKCPFTGHPLTRFTGPVTVVVEVPETREERIRREMAGRPEWEIDARIRREAWLIRERGEEDMKAVVGYVKKAQRVGVPPGMIIFHDDRSDCPGYCRFYEVRDRKLVGMSYGEMVDRVRREIARVTKPLMPVPGAPEVREKMPMIAGVRLPPRPEEVEKDPHFEAFLRERGRSLTWYFAQSDETRKLYRDAFWSVRYRYEKR